MLETLCSVSTVFLIYKHPRCYPQPHTFGPTPAWGLGIRDTPPPSENVPLGVSRENVPIREEHKARNKLGFLVFLEGTEIRGQSGSQSPDVTGQLGVLGHIKSLQYSVPPPSPTPHPSTPHPKNTLFPGEGPIPRNPCSTTPVPKVNMRFSTGDNTAAVTRAEANSQD